MTGCETADITDPMVIRPIDVKDRTEALHVLALQMKAYLLEAKLIGFKEIPPLKETVASLQTCGETFIGCFDHDELAGAVAYERKGDTVTVCRMMVHPDRHRKGIGSRLLSHVLELHKNVPQIVVSTGTANGPAVCLYAKYGFVPRRQHLIAPGITLTEMVKENETI